MEKEFSVSRFLTTGSWDGIYAALIRATAKSAQVECRSFVGAAMHRQGAEIFFRLPAERFVNLRLPAFRRRRECGVWGNPLSSRGTTGMSEWLSESKWTQAKRGETGRDERSPRQYATLLATIPIKTGPKGMAKWKVVVRLALWSPDSRPHQRGTNNGWACHIATIRRS